MVQYQNNKNHRLLFFFRLPHWLPKSRCNPFSLARRDKGYSPVGQIKYQYQNTAGKTEALDCNPSPEEGTVTWRRLDVHPRPISGRPGQTGLQLALQRTDPPQGLLRVGQVLQGQCDAKSLRPYV